MGSLDLEAIGEIPKTQAILLSKMDEILRVAVRQEQFEALQREVAELRAGQNEKLLTVKEAAAYVGVHEQTIRRWIAQELIPSLQVEDSIRVRKADLCPRKVSAVASSMVKK